MSPVQPATHRTQRLFLALWPDAQARGHIAAHVRHWVFPAACKAYAPEHWHVTLHFLGNVPAESVPELANAMAVPLDPFELNLDRSQAWPGGLVVLGVSDVPPLLVDLHARLARALGLLNHTVDTRPYRPHLTLARRAGGAIPPSTCLPVVWRVHAYALAVSTGAAGNRYQVLRRYG